MPIILAILIVVLLFGARLLPPLGHWLGLRLRKPLRQTRWMWSWLSGTEEESIQAERDYGRECARKFATQFSGSASSAGKHLVAEVGSSLANAVADPRLEFRFTVAPAAISNAFALPGGFVFVTEPLLDLCNHDRDQIAFFLGHEIGHILRGHAKQKLAAAALLNVVTARLSGAGQMLREVIGKGYSRTLELEADREALRLTTAAGFDPRASIGALQRLARESHGNVGLKEYFSSHPPLAERIRELEALVG